MSTDTKMVDITLHIDENTSHDEREKLRDTILQLDGVMSADHHQEQPHLMVIEYNPDVIKSSKFIDVIKSYDMHAELVGL